MSGEEPVWLPPFPEASCLFSIAGMKDTPDEPEEKAPVKTGLMGALMGQAADKGDNNSNSSGNGTSKESPLGQIGASVMSAESGERDSRLGMPAGMGPSANALRAAANPEGGQRSPMVRSMILEKPPSFKVCALHHFSALYVQRCNNFRGISAPNIVWLEAGSAPTLEACLLEAQAMEACFFLLFSRVVRSGT